MGEVFQLQQSSKLNTRHNYFSHKLIDKCASNNGMKLVCTMKVLYK